MGTVRLARHYQLERIMVSGQLSAVQIGVPVLLLDVTAEHLLADLRAVADRFLSNARPALRLLTFLSRKHVQWVNLAVRARGISGHGPAFADLEWRRGGVLAVPSPSSRPLIDSHRLSSKTMQDMIARLEGSPYREPLLAAIEHLASGHQARFVTDAILFGFTALETLTSGIHEANGSDRILGSSAFDKLAHEVRVAVEKRVSEQAALGEILQKIPELNRPPIVRQVVRLLEEHSVDTRGLWAEGTDPSVGLRELFGRRNTFLHAGKLESVLQASLDAERALALAEGIAFALLEGQERWLDSEAHYWMSSIAEREAKFRAMPSDEWRP
ncbi:MAG: hypothetical protein ACHQ9S_27545 [Candidatus Binatia bacterium]